MIFFKREYIGITDFKKQPLFEGDIIKFPNQRELGVIRYEINGCQFRIQFDPESNIPSCHVGLQMGKKAKAFKIGSIYGDASLIDWEV